MEFADAEGHQTRSRRRTRRVLRHTASEFLRHAEGHQFEGRLRLSSHLRGSDEPPRTRSRRRTRRVLRHTASEFLRQPEGHQFEGRLRLSSHLRGSDEPLRTRSRRKIRRISSIRVPIIRFPASFHTMDHFRLHSTINILSPPPFFHGIVLWRMIQTNQHRSLSPRLS
jgi:hypothetical protein